MLCYGRYAILVIDGLVLVLLFILDVFFGPPTTQLEVRPASEQKIPDTRRPAKKCKMAEPKNARRSSKKCKLAEKKCKVLDQNSAKLVPVGAGN